MASTDSPSEPSSPGESPGPEFAVVVSAASRSTGRVHRLRGWLWALGLTALTVLGSSIAGYNARLLSQELAVAVTVLGIMSFPYMAFTATSVRRDIQRWLKKANGVGLALIGAGFVSAYIIYAFGTEVFSLFAMVRIACFVGVPSFLIWSAARSANIVWQDWLAVACIWLPFNFGLLNSIWEWPAGQAGYILNTPMAVDLALILFVCYRGFRFVPFRFQMRWRDLLIVLTGLSLFMLVALPFGLVTGFLALNPQLSAMKVLGSPLAIFFFIAVPEELLFRGLIFGMLQQTTKRTNLAIIVSALLFGVSHWHNPGWPDFRYLGLATVAGVFYAFTFVRTGSLTASAVLHAAVDTLWDLFFHAT